MLAPRRSKGKKIRFRDCQVNLITENFGRVRFAAKVAGEPFLNLETRNSVVAPVAPHLVVHGCG